MEIEIENKECQKTYSRGITANKIW